MGPHARRSQGISLRKTGGMNSLIVLVLAAILWGAAGLARQFILAVETPHQTWFNVPDLESLLSLVATLLGVLQASASAMLMTGWLLVVLGNSPSKAAIEHWRYVSFLFGGTAYKLNVVTHQS